MLKNISTILTGDILKALCDMGHGDKLILADSNFPGEGLALDTRWGKLIRVPGVSVSDLYEAIVDLFPLDVAYSEKPIAVMELTDSDKAKGLPTPESWADYTRILHKNYPNTELSYIERFAFYEEAKKSYVIIQTGENRIYGNLLLVKGTI